MNTNAAISFLAAMLVCPSLEAQEVPVPRGDLAERFDRIDRDGDGKITPRELPRPSSRLPLHRCSFSCPTVANR